MRDVVLRRDTVETKVLVEIGLTNIKKWKFLLLSTF